MGVKADEGHLCGGAVGLLQARNRKEERRRMGKVDPTSSDEGHLCGGAVGLLQTTSSDGRPSYDASVLRESELFDAQMMDISAVGLLQTVRCGTDGIKELRFPVYAPVVGRTPSLRVCSVGWPMQGGST